MAVFYNWPQFLGHHTQRGEEVAQAVIATGSAGVGDGAITGVVAENPR